MNARVLLHLAALCAASTLVSAQEPDKAAAAEAMPNPKTEHHAALAAFVGRWDNVCKMEAMPGVPGMEKATEVHGTEHAELICNGLFVKSIVRGEMNGEAFEGLWILGYDPFRETYAGLWVDPQEPGVASSTGSYDAATKTWTFSGPTAHGEMRSVCRFTDADHFGEVCYMVNPAGEDQKAMEITRSRAKADKVAADAAAILEDVTPASEQHEYLQRMVGTWDATVRHRTSADAPWTEETGTQRVDLLCNGKWLWSDFRGTMMGMPFEGHGLVGYDSAQGKFVSYWLDSWTVVPMSASGSWNDARTALTLTGKGVDMEGRPFTSKEVSTWKDDDHLVVQLTFATADGAQDMEIHYSRKR